MESTFDYHPPPYPDSETSWKDNISWKTAPKDHPNPDLRLPDRTSNIRFERVPDFDDPDFDHTNPESYIKARDQRFREKFIAIEEISMLEKELRVCYLKNQASSYRLCRPLAMEYLRRIKCPQYTCREDRKLSVSNKDYDWAHKNTQEHSVVHGKVFKKDGSAFDE